ncbi:ATP-binding protein [Desulfosarcina ovata]|uniref:ATP-binding protein n=1 Tax=Desulfosarcina ovata TaxID=83564 RepID=UPI0038B3A215
MDAMDGARLTVPILHVRFGNHRFWQEVGLTIVKKSAQKLGGRRRIESSLGEGSTFHISLPDGR